MDEQSMATDVPRQLNGRRIGVFEVQELLGVGGMGEVYRARDTRLGRDVALKVLPPALRKDPRRVARFEREAQVLASLNHPCIGAIYGLEEAPEAGALVLELVDGDDLSDRIALGGIPIADALAIARQIAEAIEAAHRQGVVHRDLKPSNIKVRPDGTVKVLDFGLAKALAPAFQETATLTHVSVQRVGTPAYMSPEQARGEPVGPQSDIWSFGLVLYELLTGVSPFARPNTADTLASLLGSEPDYTRLPHGTPAGVRHLIRRCLEKDLQRRLHHIGDARLELEDAVTSLKRPAVPDAVFGAAAAALVRSSGGRVIAVMTLVASIGGVALLQRKALDAGTTVTATSVSAPRSIAVLPFADMSPARDQEHIADGISEELITVLSRVSDLQVTGRYSSFYFKGRHDDHHVIREKLGVEHVIGGSVRRDGDQLRVTAQLIDAGSGFQLWSRKYEGSVQDIFGIQDRIASSVAVALKVTLGLGESGASGMTRNVDAYEEWLRGRSLHYQMRPEALQRAVDHLERAFALDPAFSDALVLQHYALRQLANTMPNRGDEWTRRATQSLARARAVTPDSPLALAAAAGYEAARGNWIEAADLAARSSSVSGEGGVSALQLRASLHLASGRSSEALDALQHVRALEPLNPEVALLLADAYANTGDTAAALAEFDRGMTLGGLERMFGGASLLAALGSRDRDEIRRRMALCCDREPDGDLNRTMAGFLDRPAAARTEIRRLLAARPDLAALEIVVLANWAAYYGDPEGALQHVGRIVRGYPDPALLWRPVFRDVRRLAGFKELVRSLGLVEYWQKYGWGDFCRPTTGDGFECG